MIACAAIVAGNQAFAQSSQPRLGLTAGINLTTLGTASSNGLTINYDYRPGFQGGIFAEIPVAEKITFSPQVLFSQKGGNVNTVVNGVTLKGDTRINYLDVPLLVDFKVNSGVSLFVGPQVAFLMSQKSNITASMGNLSASDTNTDTDGFRKTLIGANVGVGYKVNKDIGLKLHYITDFQRAGSGSNDTGERNSGFALSVGYLF